MRKKMHLANLIIAAVIIILESLPYGAVLSFGEPASDGSIKFLRRTYSYFDLTPFGYGNFCPLLTAVLSCVLLIIIVIALFTHKPILYEGAFAVSIFALLTSLIPLLSSIAGYAVCGLAISLLLAAEVVLFWAEKRKTQNFTNYTN